MKVTANIATFKGREESLKKMLKSIEGQFDEVRIYDNSKEKEDLTDNGKFYALGHIKEHEYYFTLDDDIIYPKDYVKITLEQIEKFGCIITHHGRKLQGVGKSYYFQHKSYKCLDSFDGEIQLDVCGTGVTAFDTRYFHPKGLAHHPYKRMSDLVFSEEVAKQGKIIGMCSRKQGWIRHIFNNTSIYEMEARKETPKQNELADSIWKLRYLQK